MGATHYIELEEQRKEENIKLLGEGENRCEANEKKKENQMQDTHTKGQNLTSLTAVELLLLILFRKSDMEVGQTY